MNTNTNTVEIENTTTTATTTTTTAAMTRSQSTTGSSCLESPQATQSMCYYCFDVLLYELYQKRTKSSKPNKTTTGPAPASASSPSTSNPPSTATTTIYSSSPSTSNVDAAAVSSLIQFPKSFVTSWHRNCTTSTPTLRAMVSKPTLQDIPQHRIECPFFVTWEKQSSSSSTQQQQRQHSGYELRGCIGTLTVQSIQQQLYSYITASAFQDVRFKPITLVEVLSLRVSISLLVHYEPCTNCLDWIVGQHGIVIKFTVPDANTTTGTTTSTKQTSNDPNSNPSKTMYTATFLPEVAVQQQWDQRMTIQQLIRKAGYLGDITTTINLFDSIQCTRYQSSKFYVTCTEYLDQYDDLMRTTAVLQAQHEQHDTSALPLHSNPLVHDLIVQRRNQSITVNQEILSSSRPMNQRRDDMNTSATTSDYNKMTNTTTIINDKDHHPQPTTNCHVM
jgi:AMME syndrome candidate gene 1 protein